MSVSFFVRIFAWLWFGGAIAAAQFEVLKRAPLLAIAATLVALTSLALLAGFRIPPLRAWIDALDLRVLVLVHLVRFIGLYFLILHQRGELPRGFAVPSGVGDIIIATMALPVALAPLEEVPRRRAIAIWNTVGFIHLLVVIFTMAHSSLTAPLAMRSLLELPLSLFPTFLVPLLFATHVIIASRLSRSAAAQ